MSPNKKMYIKIAHTLLFRGCHRLRLRFHVGALRLRGRRLVEGGVGIHEGAEGDEGGGHHTIVAEVGVLKSSRKNSEFIQKKCQHTCKGAFKINLSAGLSVFKIF